MELNQDTLKKYAPYIAVALVAVLFLALSFWPVSNPQGSAGSTGDPAAPSGSAPTGSQGSLEPVTLDPGTPVFTGPGYDNLYLQTLGKITVTPLEFTTKDGAIWLRLAEPAGWVDITAMAARATAPVTVTYADTELLLSGDFLDPMTGDKHQPVVLRANQVVCDLQVAALSADGQTETELLVDLLSLAPGHPLVLRLPFPEFSSRYAVRFTDEAGQPRRLVLSLSELSACLVVSEN